MKSFLSISVLSLLLLLGACGEKNEDENATEVNIEKNVAPELWNSEGEAPVAEFSETAPEVAVPDTMAAEQVAPEAVEPQAPQAAPAVTPAQNAGSEEGEE